MMRRLVCTYVLSCCSLLVSGPVAIAATVSDQWVNTGLCGRWIRALALSPNYSSDKTVFAGGRDLSVTRDGGVSWQAVPGPSVGISALAISPDYQNDRTLFVGTFGSGLYKISDALFTWVPVTGISGTDITALAAVNSTTFLAGTAIHGAYITTDAGSSWSPLPDITDTNVTAFAVDATHNIVYAATASPLFKSTDGGAHWTRLSREPEWSPGQAAPIDSLAASPNYALGQPTAFAGNKFNGFVWERTAADTQWRPLRSPWTLGLSVNCMAVSNDGGTLFVGLGDVIGSALLMTDDNSSSWTWLGATAPPGMRVGVDAIAISSGNTLYLGTVTGVWTNASVTVPPVLPTSKIVTPANGAAIRGTTYGIVVLAYAECPNSVESVEISFNGAWTSVASSDEGWKYTWSLPADGVYVLRTRAKDNAGNQEIPAEGSVVTVDNRRPRSTITQVKWTAVARDRRVVITGTSGDYGGSGVTRVQVGLAGSRTGQLPLPGGGIIPKAKSKPAWVDASGTLHWYFEMNVPHAVPPGTKFDIQSRASDRAGNIEVPAAAVVATVPN